MPRTLPQLIDGQWQTSQARELIEVTDPPTQELITLAPKATAREIEAGAPIGVLQILHGGREQVDALLVHPLVRAKRPLARPQNIGQCCNPARTNFGARPCWAALTTSASIQPCIRLKVFCPTKFPHKPYRL